MEQEFVGSKKVVYCCNGDYVALIVAAGCEQRQTARNRTCCVEEHMPEAKEVVKLTTGSDAQVDRFT